MSLMNKRLSSLYGENILTKEQIWEISVNKDN